MSQLLSQDRERIKNLHKNELNNIYQQYEIDACCTACKRDDILEQIKIIMSETKNLLHGKYDFCDEDLEKNYYIYSKVKDWVIEELKRFGEKQKNN